MFSVTEVWHMLQSQFLPSCDIEKDIEGSGTNKIIQHDKDKRKKKKKKKKKKIRKEKTKKNHKKR